MIIIFNALSNKFKHFKRCRRFKPNDGRHIKYIFRILAMQSKIEVQNCDSKAQTSVKAQASQALVTRKTINSEIN